MGVVSCLQMLKYFTTPGNQPRRGVVLLFNNAEEEWLLGAHAFIHSPLNQFVTTFVNLEGAAAGGRAILFRSTDAEVTAAYRGVPHPFGTVIGSDGWKMGLIQSGTDYQVFHDDFGWRGLDIAFYRPRALYHTYQDDRKHTSKDSVWHMLANALAATINLTGDVGDKVAGSNTNGVWFDLFGDSLVLFALRGMFAWSLTILVAAPLIVIFLLYLLYRSDKDFIFTSTVLVGPEGEEEKVHVGGMKGFFRFPLALVVAGALVFASALLVTKVQPFILYSSQYAV